MNSKKSWGFLLLALAVAFLCYRFMNPKRSDSVKNHQPANVPNKASGQKPNAATPKTNAANVSPKKPSTRTPAAAYSGGLPVLSKLVKPQPPLGRIEKITGVPGADAAEVKFDIPALLQAAKEGQAVLLQLTPTATVRVDFTQLKTENGFEHAFGTSENSKDADVTLTLNSKDIVVGIIQTPQDSFQIIYSGHKTSYVVRVDKSRISPYYENDPKSIIPPSLLKKAPQEKPGSVKKRKKTASTIEKIFERAFHWAEIVLQENLAQARQVITDGSRAFRVYFYLTGVFVNSYGGLGGAQAHVANQIAIMNNSMAASGISTSMQIAGYEVTNEFPDALNSGPFGDVLSTLLNRRISAANLQFLRSNAIDFVHVMRAYQGPDACGKAYYPDYDSWNQPRISAYGIGISAGMCAYKYTVAHEIGHNLGLDHNIENAITGRTPNQYNFGYVERGSRTIMTYYTACGPGYYEQMNPNDPLNSGRTNCTVQQRYSTGQFRAGAETNNARKLNEISSSVFSNSLPLYQSSDPFPALLQTDSSEIAVRQGQTVYQGLKPNLGSYLRLLSSVPSNFFEVYRNGAQIITSYFNNETYHVVDPNQFPAAAAGDVYEFRYGNRFQYNSYVVRVAAVHTPMTVSNMFMNPLYPFGSVFAAGKDVTFSVQTTGDPLPSCTWGYNGTAMATGNTFNVAFPAALDGQRVSVHVTCKRESAYGSEQVSRNYDLIIATPPVITVQPQSQNIGNSGVLNLSVTATGYGLTYLWYKNGLNMPTQQSRTLSLTGAGLAGTYKVVVRNEVGAVTSQDAIITDTFAPIITVGAAQVDVNENATLQLTSSTIANPPPTLSWLFNNAVVGNTANLSIANIKRAQAGVYTLRAQNTIGTTTADITVRVLFKPEITVQPLSQNIGNTKTLNLSVTAVGVPAPTYQWYKNDSPLPGATNPTLGLTGPGLEGNYKVRVTNSVGFVDSNVAVILATFIPEITLANAKVDVNEFETLTITPKVEANPAATFEWSFNGAVIGKELTLSIPKIDRTKAGDYSLKATNSLGSSTAKVAVRVLYKPEIKVQPVAAITVNKGQPLTLTVTAIGIPEPQYKWFHIAVDSVTPVTLTSTTNTLTIAQIDWDDRGQYYCEISNQVGSVTSTSSKVFVPAAKSETVLGSLASMLLSPFGINLMGAVEFNTTGGFYEEHP